MPTKRNYYEVTGINRDATGGKIKSNFRKLACKESNQSQHRMLDTIQETYLILAVAHWCTKDRDTKIQLRRGEK